MILLLAVGFIIVALPDSDKRLFSISKDHGPSLQDTIGLVMILIGYGWFVKQAWKRRERIMKYKRLSSFKILFFLFVFGLGVIIVSVVSDYGYWWICGVVLLIIIQSIIFYIALSDRKN
jgi:uncharacterized membrane protein YidH (DUF202 family)